MMTLFDNASAWNGHKILNILLDLVRKACRGGECLYNDDIDFPTSFDLDDVRWQERVFQEIGSRGKKHCEDD